MGNAGRPADADFIQGAFAAEDEGFARAEVFQYTGHFFGQIRIVHPEHLDGGSRRIGQRAEQVEKGAEPELAPNLRDAGHGRVEKGLVQKPDADLADARLYGRGRHIQVDPELLQDVGAAARARHAAAPVFGDAHPGTGRHEGGGG